MNLHEWAAKWNVPYAAVADLQAAFGMNGTLSNGHDVFRSEAAVLQAVRFEAASKGALLWRNNVGAMYDKNDRFIRFGLANDSEAVNTHIKSADLVGIKPIVITVAHVGHTVGQFVSRECKPPGWIYTATDREEAQLRWAELIAAKGGDACFATGVGTL